MKKTLLATALLAGFSSAAVANSSVTLYGILDGGFAHHSTKITQGGESLKTTSFGMRGFNGVRNGNRWGLRGSEDLGDGLKVIFQLESGFDLGNGRSLQGTTGGDTRLFGRQAWVGLTSENWGTLTLGRQHTIAVDTVGTRGPFNVGYQQAGQLFGAFGASVFARMDNAIKYWSPTFAGFKVGLGYSGESNKQTLSGVGTISENSSNWITAGGSYNNGPISVGVSYDRFDTDKKAWTGNYKGKVHMWNLFGSYDFDIVKLDLGYGQVRGAIGNPNSGTTEWQAGGIGLNSQLAGRARNAAGLAYHQTNGYRQQAWTLGLTAPVGDAGKVLFSYQGSATKNTGDAFHGAKGKVSIFSLGYEHSLSKRTLVYALATIGRGDLKWNDGTPKAKLRTSIVGVGMQHRF